MLDDALYRRFDGLLHYELPDEDDITAILSTRLSKVGKKGTSWKRLAKCAVGLSYAEVVRASNEVLKTAVISKTDQIVDEEYKTGNRSATASFGASQQTEVSL